jgi:hypothetical protein
MELKPGKGLAEGPWTLALAAGMIVGFCAICSYVLFDLRRAGWDQAHSAATNLATAIQSEIARNVELYDLSLQGVVENRTEPEIGWVSPRVRNLLLFDRAATAKYMGAILLLDEQGRVVADSTNRTPRAAGTATWIISRRTAWRRFKACISASSPSTSSASTSSASAAA